MITVDKHYGLEEVAKEIDNEAKLVVSLTKAEGSKIYRTVIASTEDMLSYEHADMVVELAMRFFKPAWVGVTRRNMRRVNNGIAIKQIYNYKHRTMKVGSFLT